MYANKPHFYTFVSVLIYSLILILYVNFVYIFDESPLRNTLGIVLLIGLVYPMSVNILKIYKYGPARYFRTKSNYIDLIFNIVAFTNFLL